MSVFIAPNSEPGKFQVSTTWVQGSLATGGPSLCQQVRVRHCLPLYSRGPCSALPCGARHVIACMAFLCTQTVGSSSMQPYYFVPSLYLIYFLNNGQAYKCEINLGPMASFPPIMRAEKQDSVDLAMTLIPSEYRSELNAREKT